MAEENRNEMNAIVSILGDLMVKMEVQHREMVSVFDRGMNLIVDRLTSIDKKIEQLNDLN